MKRFAVTVMLFAALAASVFAQKEKPVVSEKQDVAIFALGYYGWDIPKEALGSIDIEIQKVFIDLGRFKVLGMTQRFSSNSVTEFVNTISKMKEKNLTLPEKYQFGEAILTEADFNKLVNAFVIAVPVVTNYNAFYDSKANMWKADINTAISFIDANLGQLIGVADVKTSGANKENKNRAVQDAIAGIPMQLQYEIRKIPQFQNKTRVLTVNGAEIKMELGTDMGVKLGDEYAVKKTEEVEGIVDDREVGLVVIKDATPKMSTATVLYSDITLEKNTALQEIPRLGLEGDFFVKYLIGKGLGVDLSFFGEEKPQGNGELIVGLKTVGARGFYDLRFFGIIQLPITSLTFLPAGAPIVAVVPVTVMGGAEYNLFLGRLAITPSASVGGSYIVIYNVLRSEMYETSAISHIGFNVSGKASMLITRDIKLWAEAGYESWLSLVPAVYTNYGGIAVGGGFTLKL